MHNNETAKRLDEIADLLELSGRNAFRVASYRNAARSVTGFPQALADMVSAGKDLRSIPDVGESIAKDIDGLLEDGRCTRLVELRNKVPAGLPAIMHLRGLGPGRTAKLHAELGIDDVDQLRQACEGGAVRDLSGFGEKTEVRILEAIDRRFADSGRVNLRTASGHVEGLERHLASLASIDRWQIAGSFRRRRATIGDIDVLVQADDRERATDDLRRYAAVDRVLSRGDEKAAMQLHGGLRIDIRFVDPDHFGAALLYFTGSKEHNVRLRQDAQRRGWKLNEYGLYKARHKLAAKTESALYHRLNMAWIPPELREARGEIDASLDDQLPSLVETGSIRGDLHMHTDVTDGEDSLHDMVAAARARGYSYIAVTDHSRAVKVADGLDEARLRRHAGRIRRTDAALADLKVLAGVEVDILKNGDLEIDSDVLGGLDWVIASVHSHFDLTEAKMTEHLLKAIESGVVDCLGHPCARQIGQRDAIEFDADDVFAACAESGVLLEINAHPQRLDLPDTFCGRAKDAGATMVVSTGARRSSDLDLMRFGVDVARRGWLEAADVANTRSTNAFLSMLSRYAA